MPNEPHRPTPALQQARANYQRAQAAEDEARRVTTAAWRELFRVAVEEVGDERAE